MFKVERGQEHVTSLPLVDFEQTEEAIEAEPEEGSAAVKPEIETLYALAEQALADAQSWAREITDKASFDAENTVQSARDEAALIRETAHREGQAAGQEEARAAALLEAEAREIAWRKLLESFAHERERVFDEVDAEIRELILLAVKKIINVAAETDDKLFETLIRKTVETLKPTGAFTVHLSDEDFDRYFPSGDAVFLLEGGGVITANVFGDAGLSPGACVIAVGDVTVDAGFESQLRQLRIAFDRADSSI